MTKSPTSETVTPGGTAYFIARADNAREISWFISSPDGTKGYNAKDIKTDFPNVTCTGLGTETLIMTGIPAELDGWKVKCKFTGPGGSVFTEDAEIIVVGSDAACRSLDEVIVVVRNKKPAGTAGSAMASAAAAARIADYFAASGISAEDVKATIGQYTDRLIYENKVAYRDNADELLAVFRSVAANPDAFSAQLKDAGYEAKSFPWDDERIAACFEALTISR